MSISRISVVIPCFNQARFLPDAIESALHQTHPVQEVIVVDDGSTDHTREVAQRRANVRYVYQPNAGLSAARNRGLHESTGDYLVYVDADDVLHSSAASIGSVHLDSNHEWAFVSGGHRRVGPDLQPLGEDCCWPVHADHYKSLLRANYIGMHAAVMYRRKALCDVGGFNERLRACEDYDLYLRITRDFPVGCHAEVVASYRQHDQNMSRDPERMLNAVLQVLEAQWSYVRNDSALKEAYLSGIRNWWEYFGDLMLEQFRFGLPSTLVHPRQIRRLARLFVHYPYVRKALRNSRFHPSKVIRAIRGYLDQPSKTPILPVQFGSFRSLAPIGAAGADDSVFERYCTEFFEAHAPDVPDQLLDIGSPACPLSFIAGLQDESRSCIRCLFTPQTFDLSETIRHLHRVLKQSGVLLAVLPGVGVNEHGAGGLGDWRFTTRAAQRLFSPYFTADLEIKSCGNAITSLAALHRLPASTLAKQEWSVVDPQFQLLVTVRAIKA
jgi:glycosyltransferase involved in cell wall biosynthesis